MYTLDTNKTKEQHKYYNQCLYIKKINKTKNGNKPEIIHDLYSLRIGCEKQKTA